MPYDEFIKRTEDPDFDRIQRRLREAVKRDPALRERVDSDERAFCSNYDRIAEATRREKIALYEALPKRRPLPSEPAEPPGELRRRSLLEQARSGDTDDAATYLDFIESTRRKEQDDV